MNELSIGSKETMTSREIAEVTGKEHKLTLHHFTLETTKCKKMSCKVSVNLFTKK